MTRHAQTVRRLLNEEFARMNSESRIFVQSKDLARRSDLSAKEIGKELADLRNSDDDLLEVSEWGESSGITWMVERK